MTRACINDGGSGSLIVLDVDPVPEREIVLDDAAGAALRRWHCPAGSIVTVKSPHGNFFRARIAALSPRPKIVPFFRLPQSVESPVSIDVFHALPEKERFEMVLEKVTETGASRIVPFTCMRSTTLEIRDAGQKKSHRWPVFVRKAALQCRRATIPELFPVMSFRNALEMGAAADLKLLFWEKEASRPLKMAISGTQPERIAMMIGPEGGFDSDEVKLAEKYGFTTVSLGGRLLRTETAAILSVALVQHHFGDLG